MSVSSINHVSESAVARELRTVMQGRVVLPGDDDDSPECRARNKCSFHVALLMKEPDRQEVAPKGGRFLDIPSAYHTSQFIEGENAMTFIRTTGFKLSLMMGFLAILTLKPLDCRAQAEIDPDHYDTIDNQPASPTKHSLPRPNRNSRNFVGKFSLPFKVDYAGLILPAGSYHLSIRQVGKRYLVKLGPEGDAANLQAIAAQSATNSDAEGPSVLVLERTAQKRTLTAIRLKETRITLDLRSERTQGLSASTELVPVSLAVDNRPQ